MRTGTRLSAAATSVLAAAALTLSGLAPAQAAPADKPAKLGTDSIAELLAADDMELDSNWKDFDILEAAVLTVLEANPDSDVAVLADGKVKLTAFAPTDKAFRQLVKTLTGENPSSEEATVEALLALPDAAETIESVLLYHVVPGKPLTSDKVVAALKASGKKGVTLKTALGKTIKVTMKGKNIIIVDKAEGPDAKLIMKALDLNEGNRQVAHGITRVLLPMGM